MKDYFKNFRLKRFLFMLVGVGLLGAGVGLLGLAGFGTDPFACMNFGVSSHLPIGYGTYQLIVNIVLFIPLIFMYPKSFGIGAIVNMVGVGYIAEFVLWISGLLHITTESLAGLFLVRSIIMIAGILTLCFGIALYMECDLGASPYDVLGQVVEDKTHGKIKFKWARMMFDILSVSIGYLAGGTVGIATVVMAFFAGPIISLFKEYAKKMLE